MKLGDNPRLFIRGLKNQPQNDSDDPKTRTKNSKEDTIPPDAWIEALERTANAPWLFHLPNDPADRLKRSFTLLFQIILYLGRPQEAEKATQFLTVRPKFHCTPLYPPTDASVPANSGVQLRHRSTLVRNRTCTPRSGQYITRAVVHDISSIPSSSPLREEQVELFGVFDALRLLHDVYLENTGKGEGEVDSQEWYEFWTRAEPMLLELAEVLDKKGFGLEPEERKVLDKDS
jgi:hypothetical protein